MEIFNHFDKIEQLGFTITVKWNQYIEIILMYENNSVSLDVIILFCSYNGNFTEVCELCCDLFYEWYNENKSLVNNFDSAYDLSEKIEYHNKIKDIILGDVSLKVSREMNLDRLL